MSNPDKGTARSATRIVLAFVAAPVTASLSFGLIMAASVPHGDPVVTSFLQVVCLMGIFGLVLAAVSTVAVGIPAYLLLKSRIRPRLAYCVLAGAILASLTACLPTAIPWGWVAAAGASGAFAGCIFWMVAGFRTATCKG